AVGRALNVGESTAQEEEARMQRLMAGEKFSYDARAMTRSGTAIDIQVAVAPLLDQANQWIGSISVARDVTQHKRSEEALRLAREGVVDLLAERAHVKGLELACSIPANLATHVEGDPLRLGQVLTNLVGNASKFTEQGSVVIRVAGLEETAQSITLRFEVSDTGAGISAAAQSHIFEEFAQADGSTTR